MRGKKGLRGSAREKCVSKHSDGVVGVGDKCGGHINWKSTDFVSLSIYGSLFNKESWFVFIKTSVSISLINI